MVKKKKKKKADGLGNAFHNRLFVSSPDDFCYSTIEELLENNDLRSDDTVAVYELKAIKRLVTKVELILEGE